MAKRIEILSTEIINTKIKRMALEIWERHSEEDTIILVGIKSGGYTIASIIKDHLQAISNLDINLLALEMNKKDVSEPPRLSEDISMKGACVVVIDDVANSGRTMGYAIIPILNQLPKSITISVLIDRMHKAFPLKAEIVGHEIATTIQDNIRVEFGPKKKISVFLE